MIKFKRSVMGVAVCCALASTGAQAAFTSFWFDADGAGATATAFRVDEFFDISGRFLAQNTYNANPPNNTYTFNQFGTAGITGRDSLGFSGLSAGTQAQTQAVRAKFFGSGTGDLNSLSVSFNPTGFMEFYNPAYTTMFAQFAITGGSGVTLLGIPNGFSTLIGKAASISAGYFFADNGGFMGADLACTFCANPDIFNFATTNVSEITSQNTRNGVDLQLTAAYSDAAVQGANGLRLNDAFGRPTQLYASANGQDRMQIPEPGSMALLGLGLVGLAAMRRRAAK